MARTGNRVKLTTSYPDLVLWLAYTMAMLGALTLRQPSVDFGLFISMISLATGAYLWGTARLLRASEPSQRILQLVALGLVIRAFGLFMAPDFSTDIFRYIFEGRVVWHKGISFPYLVAPSAAIETGLPKHLVDESFRQINHPNIPAIYPPIAQLVFVLAGGISEGLRCFGITVFMALWICWGCVPRNCIKADARLSSGSVGQLVLLP